MKKYKISVDGCDDSSIFTMELTEDEAKLLKRVSDKCNETSTFHCMPTMEIKEQ